MEYLLRTDGVRVNARDESQWTPLLSAASAGHLAVVRKLLAAGADATLANDSGRIPLHYHRGNIDMIDLLLPVTGDVDCRDDSGSTPLARAAGPGHVDAMRALLGAGAKPNLQDKYGEQRVRRTSSRCCKCSVAHHLRPGLLVVQRPGNTALHFACEERRDTAAILLVENGARLAVKNREKKTPLELATPALQASLISIARGGAGGAGGIE